MKFKKTQQLNNELQVTLDFEQIVEKLDSGQLVAKRDSIKELAQIHEKLGEYLAKSHYGD